MNEHISAVVKDLLNLHVPVVLSRPDPQFGDYATNVAMQLAKSLGKTPRVVAEELAAKLRRSHEFADVSVAGPGFINITLSDHTLKHELSIILEQGIAYGRPDIYEGKVVVAEYSDPNPFKALHAGHLYTSLAGDAISRLMENSGATVHRVNFGGDVGLHVAKAMWAIIKEIGGELPQKLADVPKDKRPNWISHLYVQGNTAYEHDDAAKAEIIKINKHVYQLHADNDHDSSFAQIYWTCRQWSYDGFNKLYEQLQMKPFEKYYPESAVADKGLEVVKSHTGDVYQLSNDATVFHGEPYGLFTQVFINSEGLPTYAGKDVGLIFHKHADFAPDQSFIITDASQKDHLSVVMTSISQFAPDLVQATTHFTHGRIKLAGGVKMSSRKGNVLMAADILSSVAEVAKKADRSNSDSELGAIKYTMLKQRIGGDIVYDPEESVSLEGNSGPYLQYAYARAQSILAKARAAGKADTSHFDSYERGLVLKLSEYTEVIDRATKELMPHYICTYLYELAQTFNRFYEKSRVIGDEREALRIQLVRAYATILQGGLTVLGIPTLEKM